MDWISYLSKGLATYNSLEKRAAMKREGVSPRSYGENMRMTKKKRKVRKSGK